jgi:hypothetical protein
MSGIGHCQVSDILANKPLAKATLDTPVRGSRLQSDYKMAEPSLEYRVRKYGTQWQWQVLSERKQILASGITDSSSEARIAALNYCLESQGDS